MRLFQVLKSATLEKNSVTLASIMDIWTLISIECHEVPCYRATLVLTERESLRFTAIQKWSIKLWFRRALLSLLQQWITYIDQLCALSAMLSVDVNFRRSRGAIRRESFSTISYTWIYVLQTSAKPSPFSLPCLSYLILKRNHSLKSSKGNSIS